MTFASLGAGDVAATMATEVRMRGTRLCNTSGRLMTILTPQLAVPLFAAFGSAGVIGMVAGLLIAQAALVALFGIETKAKPLVPRAATGAAGTATGG